MRRVEFRYYSCDLKGTAAINLHYLIRRMLGRATCLKDTTSRLMPRARIINIGRDDALIRIGANTVVAGELLVYAHGGEIQVGDWCYIGENTRIWSGARISIGNRVMISHDVNIFDNQTHPLDPVNRHRHFQEIVLRGHPRKIDLNDQPVTICDDAWIAAGAFILKGVSIGEAAIVAAGAVVTRNVEARTVVGGNPARVIQDLTA